MLDREVDVIATFRDRDTLIALAMTVCFCGVPISTLGRDDLLMVIGWLHRNQQAEHEANAVAFDTMAALARSPR